MEKFTFLNFDLLVWWLEKIVQRLCPNGGLINGDESHGRIGKQSPNKRKSKFVV